MLALIDNETPEASFLLSRRAISLVGREEELQEARQRIDRAIDLARSSGNVGAEAWARFRRGPIAMPDNRFQEGMESWHEAVSLARMIGDRHAECVTRSYLAIMLISLGKTTESLEHSGIAHSLAVEIRDGGNIGPSLIPRVAARLLTGPWGGINDILAAASVDPSLESQHERLVGTALGDEKILDEVSEQALNGF